MSSPDPVDPTPPHLPHPHGHRRDDPVLDEVRTHVDPAVAEAVHAVRDRFGAAGLRDLITLAGYELNLAEQALASLRAEVVDAPASPEDAASGSMLAADETGGDADGGAGFR